MMRGLIYIIAIILLIFIVSKINLQKNSKRKNIFLGLSTLAMIVGFGIYEYSNNKQSQNLESLANAFEANNKIICNKKLIDNSKYVLNYGTFSLIGKHNIISLKDCNEYRK